jgi:PKD repeat protein
LTVTDDGGATNSVTKQVTVTAPANQAPVASFSATPSNLSVAFDGSASSDADGSVASYAWDFGDNSAGGTGAKPSHTYAAAGTYGVKLTVTDDGGATSSVTKQVTVTAPAGNVLAADGFQRTVASGWGSADTGGAWTLTGAKAQFNVKNSGNMVLPVNTTLMAMLNAVSSSSAQSVAQFSVDKLADGTYVEVIGRRVGTDTYSARLRIAGDGTSKLYLLHGSTQLGSTSTPGFTVVPGTVYVLSVKVSGTSPTSLSAKVWKAGDPEPAAWQRTASDSTPAMQAAGSPGVSAWIPTTTANAPVTVTYSGFNVTAQ